MSHQISTRVSSTTAPLSIYRRFGYHAANLIQEAAAG
jgi:predicted acetyltransferase